jgi:hypothetical protein
MSFLIKIIVGIIGGGIIIGLSVLVLVLGLIVTAFTLPVGIIWYSLLGILEIVMGHGSRGRRIGKEADDFIGGPLGWAFSAIRSMWSNFADFLFGPGYDY